MASQRTSFVIAFGLFVLLGLPARASETPPVPTDSSGRILIMEENDYFVSKDDRHYTQGARVSYLSGALDRGDEWHEAFDALGEALPIFENGLRKRKIEATGGQSLFTPANTAAQVPVVTDRPYGAWLYGGVSLLQETRYEDYHTLENAEALVGIVGSLALGALTQNDFHQFIGVSPALGWNNQIRNEPGIALSYEKKWRFQQPIVGNLAVDVVPELGGTIGNIFMYGQAGAMARFGQNLAADYGSDRIRPSLSGTGWFDPEQLQGDLGWYLFAGVQGRIVGRNIFLDGNTFVTSRHVDKRIFVSDFTGGASVFWSADVRLDFTATLRTKEFFGQQGHPDRFGGITLVFQI